MSDRPLKILFLCTGNSCRSQMAEGWAHALKRDRIEPYSAGVDPRGHALGRPATYGPSGPIPMT